MDKNFGLVLEFQFSIGSPPPHPWVYVHLKLPPPFLPLCSVRCPRPLPMHTHQTRTTKTTTVPHFPHIPSFHFNLLHVSAVCLLSSVSILQWPWWWLWCWGLEPEWGYGICAHWLVVLQKGNYSRRRLAGKRCCACLKLAKINWYTQHLTYVFLFPLYII